MSNDVEMRALTVFQNPRIQNDKGGTVQQGDTFKTDWMHGRDLEAGGLAEPVDPEAFDREPVEAMEPHYSIAAQDLAGINARRKARGAEKPATTKPDQLTAGT